MLISLPFLQHRMSSYIFFQRIIWIDFVRLDRLTGNRVFIAIYVEVSLKKILLD